MLIRSALITVALALLCSESAQSPDLTKIPLFSGLGVRLGMNVSALERARPKSTFVPYGGFQEQLSDTLVLYTFPGTEEEIAPYASLAMVSVSTNLVGDSANSEARLYKATAELRGLLGVPTECGFVQLPFSSAHIRVWRNGETQVMVGTWKDREKTSLVYTLMRTEGAFAITSSEACS